MPINYLALTQLLVCLFPYPYPIHILFPHPIFLTYLSILIHPQQKYAQTPGPSQDIAKTLYSTLRLNLIKTVFDAWTETGFAWEQYNPETGKGQRTQHFTGWTSLVVKIMGMPDLSGGEVEVSGKGKGFTPGSVIGGEKDEL